ncbi:hypothetical protein QAD02_000565 [Eretmocerus hayati]|uniref:Uncharacterized protein n=1 Tax=Eretmocerus hayati TaxID=131215 RepID=A0ACC2NDY7_9HYME|nr:hypothetical protein QAD02_000565 [Eretmocerus hayati]
MVRRGAPTALSSCVAVKDSCSLVQEKLSNMTDTEAIQLPEGMEMLHTQVAGHDFDPKKRKVGMLRGSDGRIFKPITKPDLGDREIAFYENLIISSNKIDMDIQRHAPTYYGTREMRVFDKNVKFLELEDTTHGMSEPCVMDIKIGRRTWDPSATQEKRISEESKYADSKQVYGFCIPGFQVYRLPSGTLQRFDKSYGKKLNSKTLIEALEIFLNGSANRAPCRELVTQLLSVLWKILALFRDQRRYRFYSSSLLIAYDAKRLRQLVHRQLNDSFAESLLRVPVSRSRMMGSGVARSLGSLNLQMGSPISPPTTPSPRSGFPFTQSITAITTITMTATRPRSPGSPSSSPGIRRAIHRLQSMKRSISLQNCESLAGDRSVNSPSPSAVITGSEYPVDVGR